TGRVSVLGCQGGWDQERADGAARRPVGDDLEAGACAGDHDGEVVRVVVVVHQDVGVDGRLAAGEAELAFTVRLQQVGQQDHRGGVGRELGGRVGEELVGIDS